MVRPKKYLGQHFLTDKNIARKIVEALEIVEGEPNRVIEIGPGMGVLTEFLFVRPSLDLHLVEIDRESVTHLQEKFPGLDGRIHLADFLNLDLKNFPGTGREILWSTQIL